MTTMSTKSSSSSIPNHRDLTFRKLDSSTFRVENKGIGHAWWISEEKSIIGIEWGIHAVVFRDWVWIFPYACSVMGTILVAVSTFDGATASIYCVSVIIIPALVQIAWTISSENTNLKSAKNWKIAHARATSKRTACFTSLDVHEFLSYAFWFRMHAELAFWGAVTMLRLNEPSYALMPVAQPISTIVMQSNLGFSILVAIFGAWGVIDFFASGRPRAMLSEGNETS